MSSPQVINAVRIVSLPRELETTYDVSAFLTEELGLGDVSSVQIVRMTTPGGVPYRSAFADMVDSAVLSGGDQQSVKSDGRFHFDNGKAMDYLKIVKSNRSGPTKDALKLEADQWDSIYIPVLPKDLAADNGDVRYNNSEAIASFFEYDLKIGEVSHIDIIDTIKNVRSARIYFRTWFNNRTSMAVRKLVDTKQEFVCNGFYDGFEFRFFDKRRHMTFRKNTVPMTNTGLCAWRSKKSVVHDVTDVTKEFAEIAAALVPGSAHFNSIMSV